MRSKETEDATIAERWDTLRGIAGRKARAKGKERKKARDMAKARARRRKEQEGKVQASQEVSREEEENRMIEDTKGNAGRVAR